jgi:hypothetical protein
VAGELWSVIRFRWLTQANLVAAPYHFLPHPACSDVPERYPMIQTTWRGEGPLIPRHFAVGPGLKPIVVIESAGEPEFPIGITEDGPGKFHRFAAGIPRRIGASEREIIQPEQRARRAFQDSTSAAPATWPSGSARHLADPRELSIVRNFSMPSPAKEASEPVFLVPLRRKMREKVQNWCSTRRRISNRLSRVRESAGSGVSAVKNPGSWAGLDLSFRLHHGAPFAPRGPACRGRAAKKHNSSEGKPWSKTDVRSPGAARPGKGSGMVRPQSEPKKKRSRAGGR